MALPPLDVYRLPFALPIGHMTMQAARVDHLLIELVATVPLPPHPQLTVGEIGGKLRNWGPDQVKFVQETFALIEIDTARDQALQVVDTIMVLRDLRHRAVHDAIEVGLFEADDGGWLGLPVSISYLKPGQGGRKVDRVTPESVAHLAMQLYEVSGEIEDVLYALRVHRQE